MPVLSDTHSAVTGLALPPAIAEFSSQSDIFGDELTKPH
tara:strand:- start:457 stop:573 length:117 start_codon:yes stop_codon:yes gene_type:complete